MRKLIHILILFVTYTDINAQQYIPFPTDSAQWSVMQTINSSTFNSFQYKMNGDISNRLIIKF
jgi:hypothetical protein